MSHLMKLAEALRDIAEERDESEIEQALGLCSGFADRVTNEPKDATTHFEPLWQLTATRCSRIQISNQLGFPVRMPYLPI
jgi:hypothetical protein